MFIHSYTVATQHITQQNEWGRQVGGGGRNEVFLNYQADEYCVRMEWCVATQGGCS